MVVTSFVDSVSDEEFLSLYRRLYADPGYVVGIDELVDLSSVTKFDVAAASLYRLNDIVQARYADSPGVTTKTAITSPIDHAYGIGRMYEAISSESEEEVRVFRSLEEGLRWLRPDASPELRSTILV